MESFSQTVLSCLSMTKVVTNLYKLSLTAANNIYVYSVEFKDSIPNDNTLFRKKLIGKMREIMVPKFKVYRFTGANLFSTADNKDEYIELPTPEPQIKAIFKKVYVISLEDINHPDRDLAKAQTATYFFNVLIKSLLYSLKMIPIGRTGKFMILNEAKEIEGYQMLAVPGYKTSVRLCETGLLLEVDFASRLLSKTSVYDALYEMRNSSSAKESIVGKSVITRYGNKRSYIIDDIDFSLNSDTYNFMTPEGEMNITNYMLKKYKIKIHDRTQPLLVSLKKYRDKPSEKIYLVPELCSITGLSDKMLEDFNAMKQVSVYTKLNPDDRLAKIDRLIKLISEKNSMEEESKKKTSETPADICKDWNLKIELKPLEIITRKATPVKIKTYNDEEIMAGPQGNFFLNGKIRNPIALSKWILVYERKLEELAREFYYTLYDSSGRFGIEIREPIPVGSPDGRGESFINSIEEVYNENKDVQAIICVLSGKSQSEYPVIKGWAVKNGLITQFVKDKTLRKQKALMKICGNLCLQINSKMGGEIWKVEYPKEIPRKTMVVGIDITRDKGFTCLGVTTSYNPTFTKYYHQVMKIAEGAEISGTIGTMVVTGAVRFFEATKGRFYPELIVIYRDGVGESQKSEVFNVEVESITRIFATKIPDYKPNFMFAVVNKKQHTRFFKEADYLSGGYGGRGGRRGYSDRELGVYQNPDPGTIIHSDIINSNLYEFLIMPQYVNEGTGTPVRIHVIYDTINLPICAFEDFTNSLCYAYDNWQGPIRTPAPCKYAYSHAKLISKNIKCKPNPKLLHNKYFI